MRYPTEHRPSFFSSAPSLLRNCNSPEARRAYLHQQRASKHDLLLAAELQDIRRRVDRQISSVRGRQVQHEHAASLHERRLLSPTRSGLGSRSSSPELHKPRPLGASYRDFRAPVEADPLHDPLGDARAHAAAARREVDAEALRKTRPRPGSTGRGRREREALDRIRSEKEAERAAQLAKEEARRSETAARQEKAAKAGELAKERLRARKAEERRKAEASAAELIRQEREREEAEEMARQQRALQRRLRAETSFFARSTDVIGTGA